VMAQIAKERKDVVRFFQRVLQNKHWAAPITISDANRLLDYIYGEGHPYLRLREYEAHDGETTQKERSEDSAGAILRGRRATDKRKESGERVYTGMGNYVQRCDGCQNCMYPERCEIAKEGCDGRQPQE